uniref:Uncharacterized protein n=1 Tax=Parascaris equorum TaxID=6256 RepID=A0A914S518_PAREQ
MRSTEFAREIGFKTPDCRLLLEHDGKYWQNAQSKRHASGKAVGTQERGVPRNVCTPLWLQLSTVMACLLLASKIEEAPRRPRDVINVFHRLEHLHGKRTESKKEKSVVIIVELNLYF